MPRFHPLIVTDIHKTIRDAVVLTLEPEAPGSMADFDFTQGQYLTFRRVFDDTELRRSYSICAGRDDGKIQVGIKRVAGGVFSTWANENLRPGDRLEAMPPMGSFHTPLDENQGKSYLGFAGGSGITPLLSLIRTTLKREPKSRFTLVYANRSVASIMFREELENLKDQYLDRFCLLHILESDAQEIDLFTGLLTPQKCARLFATWIDIKTVDTAFICGPEPMMLGIKSALTEAGMEAGAIHYELFASGQPGRAKQKAATRDQEKSTGARAAVTLEGATRRITLEQGETLLDAARRHDLDAPFACKAGVCASCRCKVTKGAAEMATNHALEDYEVAQGYVLSCQATPLSAEIAFDYDQ